MRKLKYSGHLKWDDAVLTYVSMRSVRCGTKYFSVDMSFLFLIRTKYSAGFRPSFKAATVNNSSTFIPSITFTFAIFNNTSVELHKYFIILPIHVYTYSEMHTFSHQKSVTPILLVPCFPASKFQCIAPASHFYSLSLSVSKAHVPC